MPVTAETISIGNGQNVSLSRPENLDDKTWNEIKKYLQQNPQTAVDMQNAVKEVTQNPKKMAEFKEMINAVGQFNSNNPQLLEKLKNDPELAAKFSKMEKGGLTSMLAFYKDEKFLRSLSQKAGGAPMSLTEAIKAGNKAAVEQQLASGVNANVTDAQGISALHYAVGCNRPDLMKLLMEKGANVYAVDNRQNTLLHYAAGYGYADAVEYLLKIGLNVNQINRDGQTPMALATRNNKAATVQQLRMAGGHA